ncbi:MULTISPECIES: MBL fold metallo-hydrolase [Microbacterium]|uniref:MBL fold metallo-hydrolase n=1 Tax=Microbacterium TaxID=33882 RepID=UPI00146E81DF|nr:MULTISPECIES: MBL fold metallo-hydrolase [Microbacterium]
MNVPHLIFRPGVPALSPTYGSLGWSSVGIVVHGDDLLLLDTGGPGYRALWDQWLGELSADRHDVTAVLLTHSHWDHLGAAPHFPNARYVMTAEEYAWAVTGGATSPYVDSVTVAHLRATGRLDLVAGGDQVGPVEVLATPGHTPGHLSFAVTTADGRDVFAGDAIKDTRELLTGVFAITQDAAASETSRQLLCDELFAGARLLLGHSGTHPARGAENATVPLIAKEPFNVEMRQP